MTKSDQMSQSRLHGVRALVLGAGFGTRLRPFTEHEPKPAIPLLGRPLIAHPLIHLYAHGCHDAWVNTHHLADRLSLRLDAYSQRRLPRLRLRYSVEETILGTGGAVRRLQAQLGDEPFLLLNGDGLLGMDLPRLWSSHQSSSASATLGCMVREDAHHLGAVVSVADDGRIIDIAGIARAPGISDDDVAAATPTVFCGIHAVGPEVFEVLPPDGVEGCIVRQGYKHLIEGGARVQASLLPSDTLFHDVGTPGRYLDAQAALFQAPSLLPVPDEVDPQEALFQEASYAVDAHGREYGSPDAVEGLASASLTPPFFFGPRNTLGPGVVIGPNTSVGALNTIHAGARLEDCALWAQVEVGVGERLVGSIATRIQGERVVVDARPA